MNAKQINSNHWEAEYDMKAYNENGIPILESDEFYEDMKKVSNEAFHGTVDRFEKQTAESSTFQEDNANMSKLVGGEFNYYAQYDVYAAINDKEFALGYLTVVDFSTSQAENGTRLFNVQFMATEQPPYK